MTNVNYTPGPWKVVEGRNSWTDSTDDGIKVHASQWSVYAEDKAVTGCGFGIQSRANATLIAAAPDMVAALQKLNSIINPEHEELAVGFSNGDWVASMKQCRSALARAFNITESYFIDYDSSESTAVLEDVAGDIEEHVRQEIRKMYREGVYGDGPFSDTHVAAYALSRGVSFKDRYRLDWKNVTVPVGDIERD